MLMFATVFVVLVLVAGFGLIWRITVMPGTSFKGHAPALSQTQQRRKDRLHTHVRVLASDIGERNLQTPQAYAAAADYIHGVMRGIDESAYRERFRFGNDRSDNIIVDLRGQSKPEEFVVIGAHYDTVAQSPGANDNGTGISVLLELVNAFQTSAVARSLRFVAFANEEAPYFGTEAMGSLRHLDAAQGRGERIVAMLALETLGAFSDAANSQHYPPPFRFFYPSTGNFVGFVGDTQSRSLLHAAIAAFRQSAQLPSEGVAAPRFIKDVRRSDHLAYWEAGIPALMVTDTANFRYAEYHTAADTIDVVDFDALTRVTEGLIAAVTAIADRP